MTASPPGAIYGHRARIGYCSPPFVTETFIYEFYRIVPDGVTMLITTLEVGNDYSVASFADSRDRSMDAARAMGDAGADVVVLGGNPINQSIGIENLPGLCADLSAEIGAPVITSTLAQREALQRLGVRRIATAHLSGPEHDARAHRQIETLGYESVGVKSGAAVPLLRYGTVAPDLALDVGRELRRRFPDADCLHLASAHWPAAFAIEPLERELGLPVMTSGQAIIWKALRTAGIDDPIDGFGRLLRDH
jgi:maleate cis-trans isomerase